MRQARSGASPTTNGGFEAKLWQTADALRNNMDAAEYKHVVLGLIFLKYISDAFEAKHAELEAEIEADRAAGADPEDPDEYRAASIFWVPREARWSHLKASAPQPTIGTLVDDAMTAIERDNPSLKGVLPNCPTSRSRRLGPFWNRPRSCRKRGQRRSQGGTNGVDGGWVRAADPTGVAVPRMRSRALTPRDVVP